MGVITAPRWFGGTTRIGPRSIQRPMQGIDPVTGLPTSLPSPSAEDIAKDELAKASEQGMTLDKPGAIPVDKLGSGGNGNKRQKDCKCPASHLCQGKPNIIKRNGNGLEYQLYIANLKSAPLVFLNLGLSESGQSYQVTEWQFSSVPDWDGFWYSQCKLVEAKDNFGFLFRMSNEKQVKEIKKFANQMKKHIRALEPYWKAKNTKQKKVLIEWHFADSFILRQTSKNEDVKQMVKNGLMMKYTPYMTKTDREKRAKKEYEEKVKQGLIT